MPSKPTKRACLHLAVLSALVAGANKGPIDEKWISAIRLDEDFFQTKNLPAFSPRRKSAVLLSREYSCCISSDLLLVSLAAEREEPTESILLEASEASAEWGGVLTEENAGSHLARVREILREGDYAPMVPVDLLSLKTQQNGKTGLARVSFAHAGHSYVVSKIPLRDWNSPGHCCGYEDGEGGSCSGPPEIHSIHLDAKGQFALLEYGIIHPADGCDQGPKYYLAPVKRANK
jgi:hypothetical protein